MTLNIEQMAEYEAAKEAKKEAIKKKHEPHGWEEPQELPKTAEPPSFPAFMIPEPLRAWLVDVSDRASIPLEFVAIPAIVGLGSIIGRRIAIRPGRYDDWTVVPNLWGSIIGRPGVMKSYAVSEALKPLSRLASKAAKEYEENKPLYEAIKEEHKAEIDAKKKEMAKLAKKDADTSSVREELAEKIKQMNDEQPTERRYKTQDSSVEKLGELLKENPQGLLLSRDELTGWLRTLDKPGHEGDREFYLEAWNGTGSYTVDRIGRGTMHIPALCISVIGGIQPGKLKGYINGALNENGASDDGLLQRLQMTVWPDKLGEWVNKEIRPDTQAREQAYKVYEEMDNLNPDEICETVEEGELPYIRFSSEAQEVFNKWRDQLENRLRSEEMEDAPAWESHLSKYRSLMPSLALIFHLVDMVCGEESPQVSEESARLAADWCDFLEQHAQKIYVDQINPGIQAASVLMQKIKDQKIEDGDTIGSIQERRWGGLRYSEQIRSGLEVLQNHGWVKIVTEETGGRPTEKIYIHPKIKNRETP